MRPQDSAEYLQRKTFFDSLLTIYGRKPVLEALQNHELPIYKIHLADSNKPAKILDEIIALAEHRKIEIAYHNRKKLSHISKNSKQDQGIAADIELRKQKSVGQFLRQNQHQSFRLLALDSITNPQNLGMIIRSACAGYVNGILLPNQGCAGLSPLVIKASSGTLFKAPLIRCDNLPDALRQLKEQDVRICVLSSHAEQSLFDDEGSPADVFILGNETEGVQQSVNQLADATFRIPMNNGVESLNVAVTAALIAFI